jgi:hypothetical protein
MPHTLSALRKATSKNIRKNRLTGTTRRTIFRDQLVTVFHFFPASFWPALFWVDGVFAQRSPQLAFHFFITAESLLKAEVAVIVEAVQWPRIMQCESLRNSL